MAMKQIYKNGTTSVLLRIKILDTSSTVGAGLTGLTNASTGLLISTLAGNEAAPTVYTAAGGTIDSVTTLGTYAAPSANHCRFREVDSTNHPGVYEIQLADARLAVANARTLLVSVSGATGAMQADVELQLSGVDLQDPVRGGMTALPYVASGSSGSLPTSGTGANQVALDGSGNVSASLVAAALNGILVGGLSLPAALATVKDLLEADRVVDTTVQPWALVLIKKGTGSLGQSGAVELLRQRLRDVTGAPITNSNTILGQSIT